MSEEATKSAAPAWACLLAAVLAGWLVFLFAAMLVVIGISAIASSIDLVVVVGSAFFFGELAVSAVISGIASYFVGTSAYGWFSRRKPMTTYSLAFGLLLLTLVSLPMPFTFSTFR